MNRRLPDNTYTTDPDHYTDAWMALANGVAKYFPGYTVNSVDPVIVLVLWEAVPGGRFLPVDTITLSVTAAVALTTQTPPPRRTREDL